MMSTEESVIIEAHRIGVELVNLDPMAFEWCFHVFRHTIPMPGP
jgi:hypothetical protein